MTRQLLNTKIKLMNKVSINRMHLRIEYTRETDLLFSDNIPKYADWLEIKLAAILNEFEQSINNNKNN
jgi:hypothetical protein